MAHFTGTALAVVLLLFVAVTDAVAAPGQLDRRFGSEGVAGTERIDGGFAATRTRGGKIVVAGGLGRPGLLRLHPDGRADRGFGASGIATSEMTGIQPFGIKRGSNGILQVAAVGAGEGRPSVALLRFGAGGLALQSRTHGAALDDVMAGAVQRTDGGAYVATSSGLVRSVRPAGGSDPNFGDGGTINLPELLGVDRADVSALAVRSYGSLLVAATFSQADAPEALVALLQFNAYDGSLDASFGEEGIVRLPFAPEVVRELSDGDLALVDGDGRRTLRLRRDGVARPGFGIRGAARVRATGLLARDAVQGRRGRLYLLLDSAIGRAAIAGFDRRGRVLKRFGRRGVAELPAGARANDITLDRGGLLVVGTTGEGEAASLAVWRYDR